jgi:hypothetical protein
MKNKHTCFYSRWLLLISPDAIPSGPSPCDVFETIRARCKALNPLPGLAVCMAGIWYYPEAVETNIKRKCNHPSRPGAGLPRHTDGGQALHTDGGQAAPETFENLPFVSLRGEKRRGNLIEFLAKPRLLRCARNDNVGIFQSSQTAESTENAE